LKLEDNAKDIFSKWRAGTASTNFGKLSWRAHLWNAISWLRGAVSDPGRCSLTLELLIKLSFTVDQSSAGEDTDYLTSKNWFELVQLQLLLAPIHNLSNRMQSIGTSAVILRLTLPRVELGAEDDLYICSVMARSGRIAGTLEWFPGFRTTHNYDTSQCLRYRDCACFSQHCQAADFHCSTAKAGELHYKSRYVQMQRYTSMLFSTYLQ
jgi:hypothetical protein